MGIASQDDPVASWWALPLYPAVSLGAWPASAVLFAVALWLYVITADPVRTRD